jgi:hypothetical protein
MIITHTIASLPVRAQKLVLKTLVASINQFIIGYARSHIRAVKYAPKGEMMPSERFSNELAAEHGTKTFDELNREEVSKDLHESGNRFMDDAGNEVAETPLELCTKFTTLRNWFEHMVQDTEGFSAQYDSPFSVGNSLAYQIARAPQTNLDELKKIAEATGIPVERLQAVGTQAVDDDHTDLKNNATRILAIYDDCSAVHPSRHWVDTEDADYFVRRELEVKKLKGYESTGEVDDASINIENLISSLPLQSQYKLGIKVNDTLVKASNDAVKLMLNPRQRGSREAAGDVTIIDAARLEHYTWLCAFDKKHQSALDAYADRGFLPMLPDAFDEPVAVAIKTQAEKENDSPVDKLLAHQAAKPQRFVQSLGAGERARDFQNSRNVTSL